MKRVLIFSLAYYPSHVSGAEVAVKEITDRVDPGDIEFSMVTHRFSADAPSEEQIGNVHVYRVGIGPSYLSKILFIPLAALKARALHRVHPFDGAWVMMTYMLLPLMVARMKGVRVPYLLTLQDGDPYEKVFGRWFVRPLAPLLNAGFRKATVIQAISHSLAEWPARRGSTRPVVVIPNGASTGSARVYPQAELDALAHSLNKKEGDVFLLTIGRLVHQKATDVIIRALPLLPAQVHLVVVGSGSSGQRLEELAQELGVASRVRFVGQVDRNETAKYRKVCDLFVLPSRSEGQGISIISSMLAGIPVIATQVGGIADFLFDAKRNPEKPSTGWAVDPDSPEQIAEAVQYIISHPEEARAVAETATRMVEERYDWDVLVPTLRTEAFGPVLQDR
ncbi:MAG: glycosyltransferase family 4 protein [Patescibacteria group bacterium]